METLLALLLLMGLLTPISLYLVLVADLFPQTYPKPLLLLQKNLTSSTCGHSHLFDYSVRNANNGTRINGLVAGCFTDYDIEWAGESNKLWSRGVAICHNVENGNYDLEWVSLARLKKEYKN